ncbi:MAG: zinc-dependent metalloprotease [Oligoflexales bacterium]|nr:zinc-dependent metalloprotease [Oligoflexales bacterium]
MQNVFEWVTTPLFGATSNSLTDHDSGEILEGIAVEIPSDFAGNESEENRTAVLAYVSAHELGHLLGLQHNFIDSLGTSFQTVMGYFSAQERIAIGKTILSNRSSSNYDRAAIDFIYGSGNWSDVLTEQYKCDGSPACP